jgi:ribosomal protein S4E
MSTGVITGIGRSEEYAMVQITDLGNIEVPRHHITAIRPAGRGNRVVVINGEHLGKVGVIESTAAKLKGKWKVREHLTKAEIILPSTDLVAVDKFT